MNIDTILLAVLLALLLLQLVLGLLAWKKLGGRLQELTDTQQRAASTDVPTSMLVTGMARVEARLQQLEGRRDSLPTPPQQPNDRAYELAQRMARDGAGAAQIAEACGIALHEAELLTRLHAAAK